MGETLEETVERHRKQYPEASRPALVATWIPQMYRYIDALRAQLAQAEKERDAAKRTLEREREVLRHVEAEAQLLRDIIAAGNRPLPSRWGDDGRTTSYGD